MLFSQTPGRMVSPSFSISTLCVNKFHVLKSCASTLHRSFVVGLIELKQHFLLERFLSGNRISVSVRIHRKRKFHRSLVHDNVSKCFRNPKHRLTLNYDAFRVKFESYSGLIDNSGTLWKRIKDTIESREKVLQDLSNSWVPPLTVKFMFVLNMPEMVIFFFFSGNGFITV